MICAVLLAAGLSRRMGVQKLLLPFAGKTVLTHIVDELLAGAVDEVLVVTGHQAERIGTELSGRPVSIVHNADYESGMLSSVRCGLRALPQQCEAVLVALGDQPSITSALVALMVQSFDTAKKRILVPLYDGRRGHPILFSRCYCREILTHFDDVGLRGLLCAHPDEVFELPVSTPCVLSDMDYPKDYQREIASVEKNDAGELDAGPE